jgi:hypothetical protein
MGFADSDFRNSQHMRLKVLDAHIAAGRLLPSLRWRAAKTAKATASEISSNAA